MSLEKIYNKSRQWVNDFINTCISFLKVIVFSSFRVKLPRAEQKSCIILGNGPSLSISLLKHPDFFKKHALICVNGFAIAKEYTEFKPAYYVMLDPILWQDDHEGVKKILDAIIQSTTWNLNLLVPQKAKNSAALKRMEKTNANIRIHYFNYTVFKGFTNFAHIFYANNLAMPQSQNVLVASLFLSINMNFKTIFIVGADHTWHENLHVNEFNQLCVKDVHFYDNQSTVNYRLFYKDVQHTETFSMQEILHAFSKAFYGYEVLKKYAAYRQATVYNSSEVSFIDAFERKKIPE
jgi:hypothetical protein